MNQIEIRIDIPVYQKILHWVDKSQVEISGLGKVVMEDGVFVVKSASLAKQVNTGTHTEMAGPAVAKMMYELRDEPGHLNFWWHSHCDMEVFWSGEDMATIYQIGDQGWCLATVFNHKHEYRAAYYQKGTSFMPNIFVDEMNVTIEERVNYFKEDWNTEYDAKVETKIYPSYTPGASYYNQSGQYVGKPSVLATEEKKSVVVGRVGELEDVKKMLDDVETYEDLTDDDARFLQEEERKKFWWQKGEC